MCNINKLKVVLTRVTAAILLLLAMGFSSASFAETRNALIIGNYDYSARYRLVTPLNDANSMSQKLSELGYKVHSGGALFNLELDQFNRKIDEFINTINNGDSTLIFYAGHGAASEGTNYLIPILPSGVRLRSASDVRDRAISLQSILERLGNKNPDGVNMLFFDACRDAPVDNGRSINMTGLASLDQGGQPRGSFVGFSTEYGKIALDGEDQNSPFAAAMLSSLERSASAPVEIFYKTVVNQVYEKTDGKQFPIQESKLKGQHCIIECEINVVRQPVPQFGILTVNTKPLDATAVQVEFIEFGFSDPDITNVFGSPSVTLLLTNNSANTISDVLCNVEAKRDEFIVDVARIDFGSFTDDSGFVVHPGEAEEKTGLFERIDSIDEFDSDTFSSEDINCTFTIE